MTDTIQGGAPVKDRCVQRRKPLRAASDLPEPVRERLDELFSRDALDEALEGVELERITGPGGLISELAGRVIEAALRAELTGHLGHAPGGTPAGGNVRNGSTPTTLNTDLGEVEIPTPRDRDGSCAPQLVRKSQTRLAGLDERILDLYAGGLSTRDISAHLAELYGVDVGRDTISRVTAAVLEDVKAWQARPLERVYPIVYFDAMRVNVRQDRSVANRACYLALGVTCDGDREPLGIWWQDSEGAKFWLGVLNEHRQRGVEEILIACVDGLIGLPKRSKPSLPPPGRRRASCTRSAPRCASCPPRTQAGGRRAAADLHGAQRRARARCARGLPTPRQV